MIVIADEGVENMEARVSGMISVIGVATSDADPLSLSSAGW